jgi:hypothetical protein
MLHKLTWVIFHKNTGAEGRETTAAQMSVAILCVAIKANKLILRYDCPNHGLLINTCNSYESI